MQKVNPRPVSLSEDYFTRITASPLLEARRQARREADRRQARIAFDILELIECAAVCLVGLACVLAVLFWA